MAEKSNSNNNKYIVSFKFADAKGNIRTGQRLYGATDTEGAKKKASDELALSYDWHKIASVVPA